MKYLFSTIAWGDDYVARFLDHSLPTQLAAGNLDGFPYLAGSTYRLLTRRAHTERVLSSAAWRRLCTIMPAEVRYLDDIAVPADADKYALMTQYQKEVIRDLRDFDVVYFGYADLIWSTGAFAAAARRIANGCDGVFAPGLPVRIEAFLTAVRDLRASRGDAALAIPARNLVRATLASLHPLAELNIWRSGPLSQAPAFQIWPVQGQGVVMRWFHLHPVFLRSKIDGDPLPSDFEGTLDEGLIPRVVSGMGQVHLMTESDELAFCSLMPDWAPGRSVLPCNAMNLARWAERYARFVHREFFKVPFRFHGTDVDAKFWRPVEADSERAAEDVTQRLALPDSELRRSDLYAYWIRTRRGWRGDFWLGLVAASGMRSIDSLTTRQVLFLLLQRFWAAILAIGDRSLAARRVLRSSAVRSALARVRGAIGGHRP